MAADTTIQTKVVFDCTDANKAMGDLNKTTKELTAQMKLNDAEMKRDGKTTENLKQKEILLRTQIEAQKKAIAKVTEEYNKAVKAKGADSAEAKELNRKLISLKTTLANQETQLKKTTDESDNLSESLDDTKESADELKKSGSSMGETLKAGLTAAKNIAVELAKAVSDMCAQTWQLTIEAATNYDDAATAAMMNGVSYEEYMKTMYASETFDIDPNAYYNAFTKFKTQFATGNKSDVEDLREILGLTKKDFNALYGDLINSGDWLGVYEAIIGGGELTNEQIQKMFGEESVKKLQTVLGENWEAFQSERENAFEVGYVMTIDEQNSLINLSNSYQTLLKNWDALKSNLGASFAIEFEPIISDTASLVGSVSKAIQDSFGEDSLDIDKIAANVAEWLPKIIGDGAGLLRVAKIWVDLINGLFSGTLDGLSDDPEMQAALEEWQTAWGDLWGDGESGVSGLFAMINEKVLTPLWDWIVEKMAEFGAMLWDAVVNAIPKSVRGHLGIQTEEEKEITADYNENAEEIVTGALTELIAPDKIELTPIQRAEYNGEQTWQNTTNNNSNNIKIEVNADVSDGTELGEKLAVAIKYALEQIDKKNGVRTVGGGGSRVRISN